MSHLYHLYQTRVQSYQNIFVALFLTGNVQINGAVANYIISSSIVVDANLRIVLLMWVDLSSHRLTVPIIGAVEGGGHVQKPSLIVVGWMDFIVVAIMDIALGDMRAYQILLGIVSVMKRI